MSQEILEKALWDLNVDRPSKARFKEDPAAFCQRYRLTAEEAAMLSSFDVAGLVAEGVNPMLTMGYWLELEGSRNLVGYLARLQGGAA